MPGPLLSTVGIGLFLQDMLKNTLADDLSARLFVSNIVPGTETAIEEFVEMTLANYATKRLNAAHWYGGGSPGAASRAYPTVAWDVSNTTMADVTLYGYYVTDRIPVTWYWCERLPIPIVIHPGDEMIFQLSLSLQLSEPSGP